MSLPCAVQRVLHNKGFVGAFFASRVYHKPFIGCREERWGHDADTASGFEQVYSLVPLAWQYCSPIIFRL